LLIITDKINNPSLCREDANLIEAVIWRAAALVKKKRLTGAVTVLTSEDFNKGPVTSADQTRGAATALLMEEVLEKVLLLN
jgi:hypothetical protein